MCPSDKGSHVPVCVCAVKEYALDQEFLLWSNDTQEKLAIRLENKLEFNEYLTRVRTEREQEERERAERVDPTSLHIGSGPNTSVTRSLGAMMDDDDDDDDDGGDDDVSVVDVDASSGDD